MAKVVSADVVVPVYRDVAATRACLRSVLEHSGDALRRVIVVDDASPEPEMGSILAELEGSDERVVLVRNERNLGFVASCNRGLSLRAGDVVLLNSDTRVTPGWLGELLAVAHSSDRVAAVTPLSNNAGLCSVPDFCRPAPAEALESRELRLEEAQPRWTELPTGNGFCLLMRHRVLNLIGALDPVYGRGYHEENDWCARAQQHGFVILRANRALVFHLGGVSFGGERTALEASNARRLVHRYPHYLEHNREFERCPEARVAAHHVRRRLGRLSVRLEGDSDELAVLASALRAHTEVDVPLDGGEEPAITHCLAPPRSKRELSRLLGVSSHLVLSAEDLLPFRAPSDPYAERGELRAAQYFALQAAQAIIAASEYHRDELVRELHLAPEKVHVVSPGVDLSPVAHSSARAQPGGAPFFLFLGSDLPHDGLKLLLEAYALFRARWGSADAPELLLAGTSSQHADGLLGRLAQLPPGVRRVPIPSEAERSLLLRIALALVFPATYSVWPRAALSAMAAGTPVVASGLGAVPEVLGQAALTLDQHTPEELAAHLLGLARVEPLRDRLSALGRERVRRYSWMHTARRLAEVYARVVDRPGPSTLKLRRMLPALLSGSSDGE